MCIGYVLRHNKKQSVDCNLLMQKFDEYMTRSSLPIIENSNSLCHGLYIWSNFKKLNPKRAVGKMIIENKQFIFRWINTTWSIDQLWKNFWISTDENEGKYYKIDMNNICRWFFSLADNQSPSAINRGWVNPIEVTCK